MKTMLTYLMILALPAAAPAQIAETHGEFYHIGDVVKMVNCDTTGFNAGMADSNITWDFTGLAASGPMSVTTYATETESIPIPCNIVARVNGQKWHEEENSTDTYLNQVEDTTTGAITNYLDYDISKRPVAYNTVYVDTFYKIVTSGHGVGVMIIKGDGLGTLKLPTGTYDNVVRVKKSLSEVDTIGGDIFSSTATSYLWFDTVHSVPLLRIDSMLSILSQSFTIMYAASLVPSVVEAVKKEMSVAGYLHDNELLLSGDFETGNVYDVTMYNIIGDNIVKQEFTAQGSEYKIDIATQVAPGIYIVDVKEKNDPSSEKVIKVVKQ